MTFRIRARIAALIVVAVAGAGALFIAHRSAVAAAQQDYRRRHDRRRARPVRLPVSAGGPQLAGLAVRKLEETYYKPVDPDTIVAGEQSALRAYLKSKNVANVTLPTGAGGRNVAEDADLAVSDLAYAQQHYADKLGAAGRNDHSEAALHGIMNSLKDPYTVYLSARDYQGLHESLSGGNFGGIGVYIYQLKDGRIVVRPLDQMPAARAGMKAGEVVDTVGGKPVRGLALDRVEALIRGVPGSTVDMTTHPFKGTGREHSYAIVREVIHVPSVHAKMEDGLDYIRLADFGETSGDEVRKALLDGHAKGARGYILDLRDNGGGLLETAVQISSLFVPQGTIVSTIRRDGERTTSEALGTAIPGLQPLVDSREQVHRQRVGDHCRRIAGLSLGDPDRNAHVRQRRRAKHLPDAGSRSFKNHDRPVRHAARPRYPAPRHRSRHRRQPRRRSRAHRHAGRQATRGCKGPPTLPLTTDLESMKRFLALFIGTFFATTLVALPAASSTPTASPAHLSASDASEIATSYQHLTTDFYKKVDPQTVLNSVRTLNCSRQCERPAFAHASLPVMKASDASGTNLRSIDREVELASAQAHAKFTTHELAYLTLDAIMRSVGDRYTVFLTPKEFAGLNQDLDGGDFGGTGIVIQIDDQTKYIVVENVVPDGPADKAGVQQDDLITAIDGKSTKGLTVQQASTKLRGKEGTSVSLTLQPRWLDAARRRSPSCARRFTSSASTRRCCPETSATSP